MMDDLITLLKQHFKPNARLIVGFSGGPDSVLLLTGLMQLQKEYNLTLIAAHLDHQWRPESAQDAIWCQQFCVQFPSIIFQTKTIAELPSKIKYNGSKESYARLKRREFFQELKSQFQADSIVLAHHADDQLENFFIRLARGTTLTGLCGMNKSDPVYVRPLLRLQKSQILDILHQNNINFLIDNTNLDATFLRNNIRLNLIPMLEKIDVRFKKNSLQLISHLTEIESFLITYTEQTIQTLKNNDGTFKLNTFLQYPTWLEQRILMILLIENKTNFTPSQALLSEIINYLHTGEKKRHIISTNQAIHKNGNTFYFKSL